MDATDQTVSTTAGAVPGKNHVLIPTLAYWAGLGTLSLGMIYSKGWLVLLGLLLLLPSLFVGFAAFLTYLGQRSMYRNPELYETQITEDEGGNITSVKWVKVR